MRVEVVCKKCKKVFLIFPHRLNGRDGNSFYCSKVCYWGSKVGTHVTLETKKKMSMNHGKPIWLDGQRPWNKGRRGLQVAWNKGMVCGWRGENHWNWQGGKTLEARNFRKSTVYNDWRKFVFKRDNYTCVLCGRVGGKLNAHHIKPYAYFKSLGLSIDNGRTLCLDCHRKTDTYGYRVKKVCAV